nr:hypothetical protein [Tanacetum cinerariifolium]
SSSSPQIDYVPMGQHSSEYSPPKTGLLVLVFQKGDDPIDAINHMMSFLTAVVTSKYPATNNQLRTSSNPHQQATINNGKVTIQPIHGRQNYMSAGSSKPFASGLGRASGRQRVIMCYNYKGEGHMSKQCTKPKRKRDAEWFKDKVLLVLAQANGQVLQEEELEFLADPRMAESSSNQTVITTNAAYQRMTWMPMIRIVMNSTLQRLPSWQTCLITAMIIWQRETGVKKVDLVSFKIAAKSLCFTFCEMSSVPDSSFALEVVWAVFNLSLADLVLSTRTLGLDPVRSTLVVKSAEASCPDADSECKMKEVDKVGALESTGTSRLKMAFMWLVKGGKKGFGLSSLSRVIGSSLGVMSGDDDSAIFK